MTKNHGPVVSAILTVGLLACDGSITSLADPDIEIDDAAVPGVEQEGRACFAPGADFISWWAGDGDFTDRTGANAIVTKAGVSFEEAVHGDGFRFMTNTQIEIDDSPSLRPPGFTVDFWAKRLGPGQNADDTYGDMLVQKAIDADGSGLSWSYYISWLADGHVSAGVYFQEDLGVGSAFYAPPRRLVSGDTFGNDVPIFIALSVDGPDVTLYVDGTVQDTFNPVTELGFDPGASVAYGPGQMVMGSNWSPARLVGFPRTFDGIVDEVEIFGRALTQAELETIYSGGTCTSDNDPPVVEVEAVVSEMHEGETLDVSVTYADDDSHEWTTTVDYGDSDGHGDVFQRSAAPTGFDMSHTYDQDGEYTITATVTDEGGAAGYAFADIVVVNVAPTVDPGPDATILEGSTFESHGSFTDPGADSWTATVDYGDGRGSQPLELDGTSFKLSHTYAGNGSGPFTVTVTVEDDDAYGTGTAQVTVVYPLIVDQATVRFDSRNRDDKDALDVDGKLPLGLIERFDPAADELRVGFAGFTQVIEAGSFVRKDEKWEFQASPLAEGVWRIDVHDDGRFKLQANGPFSPDWKTEYYFSDAVEFSLSLGPDIAEAPVQLDERLHLTLNCGADCRYRNDDFDDDGFDDDGFRDADFDDDGFDDDDDCDDDSLDDNEFDDDGFDDEDFDDDFDADFDADGDADGDDLDDDGADDGGGGVAGATSG